MPLLTRLRDRSGYTVIELLVGLVLFAIVGTMIMGLLSTNRRSSDLQTQRIDVQQNLRTATALLSSELRQLDASDGDIKAMSATSLTIRAMRQFGVICSIPTLGGALTGLNMTVRLPLYSASRNFAAGDSLFVWYEGDASTRNDDGWLLAAVTAVANLNCPDGTSGQKLTVNLAVNGALSPPQLNKAGVVTVGGPVRGFETVVYAVGTGSDGRSYLNLTTNGSTYALIGPLTGSSGVNFTYYAANGAVTATPASVALIGIVVREQSDSKVYSNAAAQGYVSDSAMTAVALRNNPRF